MRRQMVTTMYNNFNYRIYIKNQLLILIVFSFTYLSFEQFFMFNIYGRNTEILDKM